MLQTFFSPSLRQKFQTSREYGHFSAIRDDAIRAAQSTIQNVPEKYELMDEFFLAQNSYMLHRMLQ